MIATIVGSLAMVAVASIATAAWFQVNTSLTPSSDVQTNSLRTDAFVYNKNPGHSNDDATTTSASSDAGGTLNYDHSKGGTPIDWYIVGDCINATNRGSYYEYTSAKSTGTLAGGGWDLCNSIQMFKNPGATSDKAVYFNIHFTVGTTFKVVSGDGTWLGYSEATFDFGADLAGNFACAHQGGSEDNIYCKTDCTADIYVNGGNKIAIVSRDEYQDEREVGAHTGFYVVGNNTSQTSSKANTGAFNGGNFDLEHSYEINFNSNTDGIANLVGAYYGLHLYVNDYFKVWDAGSGWYGFNNNANRGLLADSTFFVSYTASGKTGTIKCVKEGYYDIYLFTANPGHGAQQYVKIDHHIEDNPYEAISPSSLRSNGPRRSPESTSRTIYFNSSNCSWYHNDGCIPYISTNNSTWSATTLVSGKIYKAEVALNATSFYFRRGTNASTGWNAVTAPSRGSEQNYFWVNSDSNGGAWDYYADSDDGYWIVSNVNSWDKDENYKMTAGLDGNAAGKTGVSFSKNDEFKVLRIKCDTAYYYGGLATTYTYAEAESASNIKIKEIGSYSIYLSSNNNDSIWVTQQSVSYTLTKTQKILRNGSVKETGDSTEQILVKNTSTTVTAMSVPNHTSFQGWYSNPDCTTLISSNSSFSYSISSDKTIYAGFALESFTWTLHYKYFPITGSSTSGANKTQTFYYGDEVTSAHLDITGRDKSGYSFVGWFTDAACTTPYSTSTVTGPRNDLYAKYGENRIQLVGTQNGGSWGVIQTSAVSSTVTWTNISLSAGDEIKSCSPDQVGDGNNGFYPNADESWQEKYASTTNTYSGNGDYHGIYAVMRKDGSSGAGNLVIRYTGVYTISVSVTTGTLNITNLSIQPTSISSTNFILSKSGAAAPTTSGGSGSDSHVFTWTGVTMTIGETFSIETNASNTSSHANILGSWGTGFLDGGSASYAYPTSVACDRDTNVTKLGSTYSVSSATITFTLETGSIAISSVVTTDYTANNSTGSPVGIYLSYDTTNAPQTLAYQNDSSNLKIRMNYDSGNFPGANSKTVRHDRNVDNSEYDNANVEYDVKATLASFTTRTTYYCNIFHNLDQKVYMVNNIWYGLDSSTYGGNYNHTGGGFTLPAGTYNIYLVGANSEGPWENNKYNQGSAWNNGGDGYGSGDYRVYIERTNPAAVDEEHEVPVYMIGRGMPGSDLENGDYSNTKINSSTYRYVPFYAAANHTTTFPCYANTSASNGVSLKKGDHFVFSDGSNTKAVISRGNNVDATDVVISSGEIVIKHSGQYKINADGTDFNTATFTISADSPIIDNTEGGNDSTVGAGDYINGYGPSSYSKDHGVRVLNANGSTLNFGGSFDSSLFDSDEGYVSFMIELRHINKVNSGLISADISGLPSGAQYRFVTVDSTGNNVTAMDDTGLVFSSWTNATGTDTLYTDEEIDTNTTANTAYDTCFAKSTLIEVKVPYTALLLNVATERAYYSMQFSINISFKETIA